MLQVDAVQTIQSDDLICPGASCATPVLSCGCNMVSQSAVNSLAITRKLERCTNYCLDTGQARAAYQLLCCACRPAPGFHML